MWVAIYSTNICHTLYPIRRNKPLKTHNRRSQKSIELYKVPHGIGDYWNFQLFRQRELNEPLS